MSVLPAHATYALAPDFSIARILNGLWQLSGAHGFTPDTQRDVPTMLPYHTRGLTTWDLADHYGPAEEFIGLFRAQVRREYGESELSKIQAFTKWVPRPGRMTRQVVETAIDTSRRRMGVEKLDMLQFHWWEYGDTGYLDALSHMVSLQYEGKIRFLSLTNFDTTHIGRILSRGIRITSNQVQYSLIDRRPERAMIPFCLSNQIVLFTYGTLLGGLLTDKFYRKPEPAYPQLNTASLRKYKQMIDAWGGWALFQELLEVLRRIGTAYGVSIANVATRYILDQPTVAGVIIGARLGVADHADQNLRSFSFSLTPEDRAMIHGVTSRGRDLFKLIGDCGDEYRR
jgi:aryl-alcohol dehydrogenase-like predicted oxidoreductase